MTPERQNPPDVWVTRDGRIRISHGRIRDLVIDGCLIDRLTVIATLAMEAEGEFVRPDAAGEATHDEQ